jgi:hypothetical protein
MVSAEVDCAQASAVAERITDFLTLLFYYYKA